MRRQPIAIAIINLFGLLRPCCDPASERASRQASGSMGTAAPAVLAAALLMLAGWPRQWMRLVEAMGRQAESKYANKLKLTGKTTLKAATRINSNFMQILRLALVWLAFELTDNKLVIGATCLILASAAASVQSFGKLGVDSSRRRRRRSSSLMSEQVSEQPAAAHNATPAQCRCCFCGNRSTAKSSPSLAAKSQWQ